MKGLMRFISGEELQLAGFVAIVIGLALWSIQLSAVVGGAILVAVGILWEVSGGPGSDVDEDDESVY